LGGAAWIQLVSGQGLRVNDAHVRQQWRQAGSRIVDVPKLQKLVKDQGFLIDGGYGKIKGATFRISNMGDETESSMQALYTALDQAMQQL